MAKNESFHKKFEIEIKGISTNGFVPSLVTDFLTDWTKAINMMYQQTDATIKVTDLKKRK